ncbi:hypothetical protein M8C21_010659 [Ambrosia artemisiifolia]|uniref:Rieske domain-containing protein n=1 Tax=Ambrosia artemisiifolia TaxID=4212 RepID=A0AAD5CJ57_AMBAR|nr:hypothetical protein M8C21_010659 [Ambrosia artemisiifolia]
MEALRTVSTVAPPSLTKAHFSKPILSLSFAHNLTQFPKSRSTKFNVISPSVSTPQAAPPEEETETESLDEEGKFDWFSHWYALMPCVYHGWCFGGSGDCKLIPQAPLDGPPVHTFPKACVGVYPCTVQYGIVWFWPNTDPLYKDILNKKKPPYIPELAHPSYAFQTYYRDIPYGYEVDREGGTPIDMKIEYSLKDGFATTNQQDCTWNFVSPYTFKINLQNYTMAKLGQKAPEEDVLVFFCIPVSPGNSRLLTVIPRHLYWSHVVNCSTCNGAYKRFKALEISLQVFSVASTAIMAATKPGMISVAARSTLAVAAILCFGGSLWLSRFIYKTFHFHDYNHAFK